jgi:hypothetical protein
MSDLKYVLAGMLLLFLSVSFAIGIAVSWPVDPYYPKPVAREGSTPVSHIFFAPTPTMRPFLPHGSPAPLIGVPWSCPLSHVCREPVPTYPYH